MRFSPSGLFRYSFPGLLINPLALFQILLENSRTYLYSWPTTSVNETGEKLTAGLINNGGKFTASVNDTGGHIFSKMSTTPVVNLPLVSYSVDLPPAHSTYIYRV
jgi:hypothetical protein